MAAIEQKHCNALFLNGQLFGGYDCVSNLAESVVNFCVSQVSLLGAIRLVESELQLDRSFSLGFTLPWSIEIAVDAFGSIPEVLGPVCLAQIHMSQGVMMRHKAKAVSPTHSMISSAYRIRAY